MVVVAHGNVEAYCEAHGFVIGEHYTGDVSEYEGDGRIIVTDNCSDERDYYYLKYKLIQRGIELVSTHWSDEAIEEFVTYLNRRETENRRKKYGGRQRFGYYRKNGEVCIREESLAVVRRIFELRDAGETYQRIVDDPDVHHPDGRKLSISTVQVILRNRKEYEL